MPSPILNFLKRFGTYFAGRRAFLGNDKERRSACGYGETEAGEFFFKPSIGHRDYIEPIDFYVVKPKASSESELPIV